VVRESGAVFYVGAERPDHRTGVRVLQYYWVYQGAGFRGGEREESAAGYGREE